jgi:hypothetical protein
MAVRYTESEGSAPPRKLGKAGQDLWDRICCDFVLADECERETLCQIAEAVDHAAELCAAIVASANQNLTHQIRTGRGKELFFEVPYSVFCGPDVFKILRLSSSNSD